MTDQETLDKRTLSERDICTIPEFIVKRVEQLLGWCDALEAQLADAEREMGRLVESVLAGV